MTGVGVPISIALASTGVFFGVGSAVVHKLQKIFDSKAKKHDKIKTLSESKLDSISGLVSKAIEEAKPIGDKVFKVASNILPLGTQVN